MIFSNNLVDKLTRPLSTRYSIQKLTSSLVRGRSFQIRRLRGQNKLLNIGCGPNAISKYINLDYLWRPGVDVCWDITKGLPFNDNSFEGVFTEHCLEHISLTQCEEVLREIFRVLAPGGRLRIVLPDAELYIRLYTRYYDNEAVEIPYVQNAEIENGYCAIRAINRVFREHGHCYAYDFNILRELLLRSGFSNVSRESFMCGGDPRLLVDSESRKIESLYTEALKGF